MTILWLVAPQIDYGVGGAMEVAGAEQLWQEWLELAKQYDQLWLSLESHPADHLSFAGMHMWSKPGQVIELPSGAMELCIMHCVSGSFGAMLQPAFNDLTFSQQSIFGTDKDLEPMYFFEKEKLAELQLLSPERIDVVGVNHTEIIARSCLYLKEQALPVSLHYAQSRWPSQSDHTIKSLCI